MTKHKKQVDFDEIMIKPKTLAIGGVVVLVVALVVAIFLAYSTKTSPGIRLKAVFSKNLPLPVAVVNYRHWLLASDLEKNLASVQQFYATQNFSQAGMRIDFSTPDGQKRLEIKKKELLQKMVEDKAIELLANEKGIKITQAQVDKIINQKLQEFGTADEVKKDLLTSYGWSIEDFKMRVVLPGMYKEELEKYFNEHDANSAQAHAAIMQAQKALASGKTFAQVATQYSAGASKEKGGELGWVKKSQLLPELQTALFGTTEFENGSVIESSIGFHLVEVENRKQDGDEATVQLRQIFVAKKSFADWLASQMKKMSVLLPTGEFSWNSKDGVVEFKDSNLTKFENEARANAEGDASIIF
ncbi:MAG: peptidylprolyl isomerase [Candidatus Moraniibacteriota bacterium]